MLASRSYDGMTVSLKLWGEEQRKGMHVSADGWNERCVRAVAACGDPPAGGRKRQPWHHADEIDFGAPTSGSSTAKK
jgi:hypothetical protein